MYQHQWDMAVCPGREVYQYPLLTHLEGEKVKQCKDTEGQDVVLPHAQTQSVLFPEETFPSAVPLSSVPLQDPGDCVHVCVCGGGGGVECALTAWWVQSTHLSLVVSSSVVMDAPFLLPRLQEKTAWHEI